MGWAASRPSAIVGGSGALGGVEGSVAGGGCPWRVARAPRALRRAAHLGTGCTCVLHMVIGVRRGGAQRLPRRDHRAAIDARRPARRHFLEDIIAAQLRLLLIVMAAAIGLSV